MTKEEQETTNVKVVDAICGAGKSTYAIEMLSKLNPLQPFLYVAVTLKEIDRIVKALPEKNVQQPTHEAKNGLKLNSLKTLLARNENIATSHSLILMADSEVYDLIEQAGYIVVIDEALTVLEPYKISASDFRTMIRMRYIEIVDNRVVWRDSELQYTDEGLYTPIKRLAEQGVLYYHRNRLLFVGLNPRLFSSPAEVYLLTYLFKAQLIRYYLDMLDIKWTQYTIDKGKLFPYDHLCENRAHFAELINIYDNKKYNEIGEKRNEFSKKWLSRCEPEQYKRIKGNIYSYVHNVCKAKADEVIWTTFLDAKNKLKGRGYTSSFLSCNARGTNDYAHCSVLIYALNRFMSPHEKAFFQDNGITVDEDMLALSDLLQWIFRSRLRNNEKIRIYIPSSRMRTLLELFLHGEI
ncbi:hypothetical protein NXZ75_21910 [Lysinibacillus sphaericus]|uniref:hypothetical protein n=1 Tax=Lysinibacillus sphaericus TaxID=1421 RepID=UPI00216233DA|nr:hypothetical protein [Lysinibacillus sphaericus]MCS1384814.1 hypothetical protein [Lysinibacillus sphaericus]